MDFRLGQTVWYKQKDYTGQGKDRLAFGTITELNLKDYPEAYVVLEHTDEFHKTTKNFVECKDCYESEDALRLALEKEQRQQEEAMGKGKFKLGQTVWYERQSYTGQGEDHPVSGTVKEINPKNYPEGYVVLECTDRFDRTVEKYIESKYCYESEGALRSALEEEQRQGVSKYTDQISSVEDLVKFMYERMDGNCFEKEAVREMTEKLVGINLEPQEPVMPDLGSALNALQEETSGKSLS